MTNLHEPTLTPEGAQRYLRDLAAVEALGLSGQLSMLDGLLDVLEAGHPLRRRIVEAYMAMWELSQARIGAVTPAPLNDEGWGIWREWLDMLVTCRRRIQ